MGLFKKIGKALGKVAKVALPAASSFIPGIGPVAGKLVGAAVGAAIGSKGAKKASGAQTGAYDAAIAEQRNALAGMVGYQNPYLSVGSPAINALMRVNSGDYSGFKDSPDYLYARDEALNGVQNSAAARGGLFSGNAGRRLAEVSSGLASQNLGNYRNALMGQIGIGQSAANAVSGAIGSTAGNIGNALMGAGDARASGIVGSTNSITNGIDQAAGALGDYFGNALVKKKKPVKSAYALNYTPPKVTVG